MLNMQSSDELINHETNDGAGGLNSSNSSFEDLNRIEPENDLLPEQEALLAGIQNIDWHQLQHAYGTADDVPRLLRWLLSDDPGRRGESWNSLYSSIWHQGTVYQASAYVVPFLLNMLGYDGPPGKVELLDFLACLAQGNSYLAVHARTEDQIHSWKSILQQQGRDFETVLQDELGWVQAANQAVAAGLPTYFELLSQPDIEIKCLVLQILACLNMQAGEIIPRLQDFLDNAPDPESMACTLRALHDLMDAGPAAKAFFEKILDQIAGELYHEKARFVAAVALTDRHQDQTLAHVERIIHRALGELGRVTRHRQMAAEEMEAGEKVIARYEFPWGVTGLQLGLQTLVRLGLVRGLNSLLKVLPLMQDGESARQTGEFLLDLAFNQGQIQNKATAVQWLISGSRMKVEYWRPLPQPERKAIDLNPAQYNTLQTLLAHEPFWYDQHDLLKLYGLPATRKELGKYLASVS